MAVLEGHCPPEKSRSSDWTYSTRTKQKSELLLQWVAIHNSTFEDIDTHRKLEKRPPARRRLSSSRLVCRSNCGMSERTGMHLTTPEISNSLQAPSVFWKNCTNTRDIECERVRGPQIHKGICSRLISQSKFSKKIVLRQRLRCVL
ncbi:hypothetical protein VN97_g9382 [Penicillium thymicola]|uniref:Uncharacterized protein n=1 Tax=Penicillium thymicola TaxID=293382 RepID=A0AAI9X4X0_PENTH|nr:hypothetical protein VN97_g9382 [Penicillium thymicola]